ncbi:hypothetical protein [Leptolyngbya sp. FACHB-711]|uniref:hypothetical protein n=1 Tax=Leptolyngbya sp. FACHB-711 TaxID=2692813 RepID=UPI001684BA83|nr:hypothetical protein [Leptolyngbya sp. FACHB-711]MBD2025270.1 hypothetical protein [Leptolyngbya sp. FACHB-711]
MKLPCVSVVVGSAIVPVLIAVQPALSQEAQGCFMVNPAGRKVELNNVCRPMAQPVALQQTEEEVAQIMDDGATLYADTWCESRARGGTLRQASDAANSAAAEYLAGRLPSGRSINSEWLASARETASILCPEYRARGLYN